MTRTPDPEDLLGDDTVYSSQLERRAAYEEAAVRFILTRFEMGAQIGRFVKELKTRTGQRSPKLSFAWFYSEFPDFPVRLGVGRTISISDLDPSLLFKPGKFERHFLYKDYLEMSAAIATDEREPVGMIFRWPSVTKFMILHGFGYNSEIQRPRYTTLASKGTYVKEAVVERLDGFLDDFVNWEPPSLD